MFYFLVLQWLMTSYDTCPYSNLSNQHKTKYTPPLKGMFFIHSIGLECVLMLLKGFNKYECVWNAAADSITKSLVTAVGLWSVLQWIMSWWLPKTIGAFLVWYCTMHYRLNKVGTVYFILQHAFGRNWWNIYRDIHVYSMILFMYIYKRHKYSSLNPKLNMLISPVSFSFS